MKALLSLIPFCFALHSHAATFDEMSGGVRLRGPTFLEQSHGDPSQGQEEQARGFYSSGTLVHADTFPWEGEGFVKILRPRDRRFATHDLIYVLRKAIARMQKEHPSRDRIQVADIAAAHGGSLEPDHNSHQNGLDADIAYIRADGTEQDPNFADGFQEVFVKDGRLTPNFDMPRNWALVKAFVASGRVNRMFVNEVVKQAFCDYARQTGELDSAQETLRRLRPYEGHMDHVHVRITCPLKSPNCSPQEEVPDGNGCS
jgi:penicillin-insensitive murein DD-endopeptidase